MEALYGSERPILQEQLLTLGALPVGQGGQSFGAERPWADDRRPELVRLVLRYGSAMWLLRIRMWPRRRQCSLRSLAQEVSKRPSTAAVVPMGVS
jgi:hypothetical protein